MTKNAPIALMRFQVRPTGSDEPQPSNPVSSFKGFDGRNDFIWLNSYDYLTVAMTFSNEKCIRECSSPTGIRCPVTITLYNTTQRRWMCRRELNVYLKKGLLSRDYLIELPFDEENLDSSCTYTVVVREERTKCILGEHEIHLFGPDRFGSHPILWYTATRGGLTGFDDSGCICSSVNANDFSTYNIVFYFRSSIEPENGILPELEIRIFYPDGSSSKSFCRPQASTSTSDGPEYYVKSLFCVEPYKRGIVYAELRCMDIRLSGFVFSTDGPDIFEPWYACDMGYIVDYTLNDGTYRFHKLVPHPLDGHETSEYGTTNEDHENKIEEDEFDQRLDAFIASCRAESESQQSDANEDKQQAEEKVNPISQLVGLDSIKEKLITYEKVVTFNVLRSKSGLPSISTPLHAMFLGSPGTGKTTVAQYLGQRLADVGVLSKGHVVVRERANLLGRFYNSESENTLEALQEAQGGILFIDEAYQLYQPNDPRDPGRFVIEALLTALADENNRDWMLILAGYPEPMRQMFEMNPGFKSRIPDSNIYTFEDFTESQLIEIAERYFEKHSFSLDEDARTALCNRLRADYANRTKSFGNARHVINLIQTEILQNMAIRVTALPSPDTDALSVITASDIPTKVIANPPARPRVGFVY